MSAYSEKKRRCVPLLTGLGVNREEVSINTETRDVKLDIARVLPTVDDDHEPEIMNVLSTNQQFKTGGPPESVLFEDIGKGDPRSTGKKLTKTKSMKETNSKKGF